MNPHAGPNARLVHVERGKFRRHKGAVEDVIDKCDGALPAKQLAVDHVTGAQPVESRVLGGRTWQRFLLLPLEPDDLRTNGHHVAGAQLRVGLSYHTPLTPYLGLGATLFAARLTYPELSDDPGTLSTHRFGLGVLLEWGRR